MATMEMTTPPKAGKKRYHVGMVEGGPVWSITLAGFTFPVYTVKVNALGQEIPSPGAYCYLDETDKEKIYKALAGKVVRWVKRRSGEVIRADVYDKQTLGFVNEDGDQSLADYVYMNEAPEIVVQSVAKTVAKILEEEKASAAKSEDAKANDPKDKKTKELHGKLKATGGGAPLESGEL